MRKKKEADLPLVKPKPHCRIKKENLLRLNSKKKRLKLVAINPESA
jgi:hypothetical protein